MKKFPKGIYSYVLMMGHLCADISGGALPAILPFLITEKGITYAAAAGLTFALSSIGSVIQPVFGSMADKTSRPWLMALGIFMSGCGISMLGFIDSYWMMFAAVAFTGIGSALFHPDGGRMANYVGGEKKGRSLSLFSVGGNMGGALGPMLAVAGITLFGGLKGTVVLALPAFTMAAFMLSQNNTFGDFAAEGTRATKAAIAIGQKDDWKSFFKLTGVVFLRSTIGVGMSTFLPMFWMSVLMQSEAASGSITTILSLSGAVATLIGGRLADKYGFNKTIRTGLTLLIPCLCILTLSRSVLFSTFMLIPTAMSLNLAFSPSVALGQKFVPNHIGLASGITMGLASSFGGMVSPMLGRVADITGVSTVLYIIIGLAVLACVASYFVPDAPSQIAVGNSGTLED
ncbi:MAG: MFS transporter [Clostridia bacterium]|nr:MFS transporter [Clostridia bacterium]